MIDERSFESLIVTNTIVAAFCIVLLIALIIFIVAFFIPSYRFRWFGNKRKDDHQNTDLLSLSRQSSFHHVPSSTSSRFNPIFESTPTTATQFGNLFHPQASIATLLHPTIWASMAPSSVISSPLNLQSPPTSTRSVVPPPIPSHPPTTTMTTPSTITTGSAQRSPKRR